MVEIYGPNEENDKEMERFWNDLERIVDRVRIGYRLVVLGDLNGWVGNRVRVGITGVFRILGEIDN